MSERPADDWDFCLETGCVRLFKDECKGPAGCLSAQRAAQSIQIWAEIGGRTALVALQPRSKEPAP